MSFYDRQVGGLSLHTSGLLERAGVIHGFTTRQGGVSSGIYASLNLGTGRGDDRAKVRENYRRVCAALGVEPEKLVFSCQVHGNKVRSVALADKGKGLDREVDYDADGLITDVPGLTLTVCFMIRSAGSSPPSTPDGGVRPWGSWRGLWRIWSGAMAASRKIFWRPSAPAFPSAALRRGRRFPRL